MVEGMVRPYRVAPGTYVIPELMAAPPVGSFYLNSMLIQALEPVIVDTGTQINRARWLEEVFALVEPADVRWVFLSHDDADHAGNLLQVLDACPNATLITTWFGVGRMADHYEIPMSRVRFVRDGESFTAGDRTLQAVRPPLYDNPVTRGLFDQQTGVYWAVDSFATPVSEAVDDLSDLPRREIEDGLRLGARLVAPWHSWLDHGKWGSHVDHVRSLGIQAVASCHAPAIRGDLIDRSFDILRSVPDLEPWQEFGQDDLDAWMATAGV